MMMNKGNFWGKKNQRIFSSEHLDCLFDQLVEKFYSRNRNILTQCPQMKKKFSKSLSPNCSPGLVEDNFENPAEFFLPRGNKNWLNVWNDKHYNFLKSWIFPQKFQCTRKKLFWELCPKFFINMSTFTLSLYQVDEFVLNFFKKTLFPKMFHWTLRMQFGPPW